MADSQTADTTQQVADTTQQVTSQIPVTSVSQKNPKRVAAGKAIAEKRRQAREEQNKKLAEANAVIAKEELRKAEEKAKKAEAVVDQPVVIEAPVATPAAESKTLTTTQWLSIASIIVSLAAIYYKREEIKGTIAKIKAPLAKAPAPMAPAIAKEPVLSAPKKNGIRPMD